MNTVYEEELVIPIVIVKLINRWWNEIGRKRRKSLSAIALHIEEDKLLIREVPK